MTLRDPVVVIHRDRLVPSVRDAPIDKSWSAFMAAKDRADAAYAVTHPGPDDPSRCWSCGHAFGDGCECTCCNDDDPHGEWNPDA